MRSASMLLCAFLVSGPVLAHVSPTHKAAPLNGPPEGQRLFFPLSQEHSWSGPKTLAFRIQVDGRPYLTETLALSGIPLGKPSFELLAEMRPVLETLRTLGGRVRIQVLLDGRKLQELSLQELALLSPGAKRNVQEAKSSIRAFVPGALPKPEGPMGLKSMTAKSLDPQCVSYCEDDLDACADNQCGGVYCEECDGPYQSCLASCECTDPKNQYTYQTTQQVRQNFGSACLYTPSEGHAHWYSLVVYQTKTTTWLRTEYCDGSVTVDEVSSSYSSDVYCPEYTRFHCYPDEGTFTGCHY